jgi:hypothetical protein
MLEQNKQICKKAGTKTSKTIIISKFNPINIGLFLHTLLFVKKSGKDQVRSIKISNSSLQQANKEPELLRESFIRISHNGSGT